MIAALIVSSLAGCGSKETNESTETATKDGVTTIQVAYSANNFPLAYTDDDGKLTGYEIEVIKKVDELLPQYEFEYTGAQQDAVFTGLGTGKYQIALTNSFYTEQRAENYNIPEHQLGASPVVIVVRKENEDIKTLEQASEQKLKAAPSMAGDGLTYQMELYNKNNPDKQIEITYTDSPTAFTDSIGFVAEGRADYTVFPYTYFTSLVEAEDGSLHQYVDKVVANLYAPVPTYPIIEKGNDELTTAIDGVLAQLREDGTLEKISEQFFGYNAFEIGE